MTPPSHRRRWQQVEESYPGASPGRRGSAAAFPSSRGTKGRACRPCPVELVARCLSLFPQPVFGPGRPSYGAASGSFTVKVAPGSGLLFLASTVPPWAFTI